MAHNDMGMSLLDEAVADDAAARLGEDVMVLLGTVERVDPVAEETVLAGVCAIAVAAASIIGRGQITFFARAIMERSLTARAV